MTIDFFKSYSIQAEEEPAMKTLRAAQAAFTTYIETTPQRCGRLVEGPLPLGQFANWIARKFGNSKKSLYGRWSRYDGSFWRLLQDRFGNGKEGYDALINLLDEFSNIRVHRRCTSQVTFDDNRYSHDCTSLEAWECIPSAGYLLNLAFTNGEAKVEGFYSSLDELLLSAEKQYGVPVDRWRRVS